MSNFMNTVDGIDWELKNPANITETFDYTGPDDPELKKALSSTDIRPSPADRTLEAWMYRISLWGKPHYEHYDPETKQKKEISGSALVKKMTDPMILKMFGSWDIEPLDFNRCRFEREYFDMGGKKVKETVTVWVDLNKNIKKATSWWRMLNPFIKGGKIN